ncbi:hypothetical protein K431DRAFT_231595, partial [Polychaeton citri CBS 116435]
AEGGEYGNALQAASLRGHTETVQLLLDSGANFNVQGGHTETVQLLLKNGTDVDSGERGNAEDR